MRFASQTPVTTAVANNTSRPVFNERLTLPIWEPKTGEPAALKACSRHITVAVLDQVTPETVEGDDTATIQDTVETQAIGVAPSFPLDDVNLVWRHPRWVRLACLYQPVLCAFMNKNGWMLIAIAQTPGQSVRRAAGHGQGGRQAWPRQLD